MKLTAMNYAATAPKRSDEEIVDRIGETLKQVEASLIAMRAKNAIQTQIFQEWATTAPWEFEEA